MLKNFDFFEGSGTGHCASQAQDCMALRSANIYQFLFEDFLCEKNSS